MREIANRIKQARIDAGLTQQQLATKLGSKSRSFICDMENDRFDPSIEMVKKIAKALNVDPGYLIFGSEDIKDEINRLFDLLTQEQQESVLQFLRTMLGDRAKT